MDAFSNPDLVFKFIAAFVALCLAVVIDPLLEE